MCTASASCSARVLVCSANGPLWSVRVCFVGPGAAESRQGTIFIVAGRGAPCLQRYINTFTVTSPQVCRLEHFKVDYRYGGSEVKEEFSKRIYRREVGALRHTLFPNWQRAAAVLTSGRENMEKNAAEFLALSCSVWL